MSSAIPETSSKNTKRPRGRPPILSGQEAETFRGLYFDNGARFINNKIAMCQAISWLRGEPGVEWLFEGMEDLDGTLIAGTAGQKPRRFSIFYELGRLPDKETALTVAQALCQLRSKTTREAVARIRRLRISGKNESKGSLLSLTSQLERVINAYLWRYPYMPSEKIILAVQELLANVQQSFAGETEADEL